MPLYIHTDFLSFDIAGWENVLSLKSFINEGLI